MDEQVIQLSGRKELLVARSLAAVCTSLKEQAIMKFNGASALIMDFFNIQRI